MTAFKWWNWSQPDFQFLDRSQFYCWCVLCLRVRSAWWCFMCCMVLLAYNPLLTILFHRSACCSCWLFEVALEWCIFSLFRDQKPPACMFSEHLQSFTCRSAHNKEGRSSTHNCVWTVALFKQCMSWDYRLLWSLMWSCWPSMAEEYKETRIPELATFDMRVQKVCQLLMSSTHNSYSWQNCNYVDIGITWPVRLFPCKCVDWRPFINMYATMCGTVRICAVWFICSVVFYFHSFIMRNMNSRHRINIPGWFHRFVWAVLSFSNCKLHGLLGLEVKPTYYSSC